MHQEELNLLFFCILPSMPALDQREHRERLGELPRILGSTHQLCQSETAQVVATPQIRSSQPHLASYALVESS